MRYEIFTTTEFDEWLEARTAKEQSQIEDRLDAIAVYGHFGDHKSVTEDNSVWELRWKNGRRLYYKYILNIKVLILLGGNKNGKKKDIKKAGNILARYI